MTRHGGSLTDSTGTLMEEMVLRGPSQYDCLVLYENLAIDYMKAARERWGELCVDYPDPNLWNEHPYYILDVPWSEAEPAQAAAAAFLDFLMSRADPAAGPGVRVPPRQPVGADPVPRQPVRQGGLASASGSTSPTWPSPPPPRSSRTFWARSAVSIAEESPRVPPRVEARPPRLRHAGPGRSSSSGCRFLR